jgi:hypothetical protein
MLSRGLYIGPKTQFVQPSLQRCFFSPEIPTFTPLTSLITFYPFCTNNFRLSLIFPLSSFFFHLPPFRIPLTYIPPPWQKGIEYLQQNILSCGVLQVVN